MDTSHPFFRKARGVPVYYHVDPSQGIIESLKNWPDHQKAIDRFPYEEAFAQDLHASYAPISSHRYEAVRNYIVHVLAWSTGLLSAFPPPPEELTGESGEANASSAVDDTP